MMTTKVVILNWNGEDFLRRFLPRVVASLPTEGVGVVVADNGSTDGSAEVVCEGGFSGVEWLPLGENWGYAEGYNKALAQIEADLFVLLNSDVEPADGWLEPLVDFLAHNPEVAAVQPKILSYLQPDKFEYAGAAGGYIDRFGYPFCRGRIMGRVESDRGQYDDVQPLFWASGACMVIRAEAFRAAGGFDGDFFAHMEEIDLCWRLQLMGYKIGVVPASVVYHVGGGTLPNNSPRKIYLNFRNSLCMLHKCLAESELWRLRVRRVMDNLSCLVYLITGKREFARQVRRAHADYRAKRRGLDMKRAAVQESAVVREPNTIYRGWIVGRYALGAKNFSRRLIRTERK